MSLHDALLAKAFGGGTGGGSASIDVTAAVGQTIVVKEVDASGKPTKWESADYQPRTHWSELGVGTLLPLMTIVPVYDAQFGLELFDISHYLKLEVGKTYTVVFDGVDYTGTATAGTYQGLPVVTLGNTYLTTGVMTNEPFIVATIPALNATAVITLAEGSGHTIRIIGEKTIYHEIPREYLSNEFRFNLTFGEVEDGINGKLPMPDGLDWDELKAAIRAGKTVYADFVAESSGWIRISYILTSAMLDIDTTESTEEDPITDRIYMMTDALSEFLLCPKYLLFYRHASGAITAQYSE